jgi:D-alanyl-lipoteichoic acid acyltransferase DltB (MBOAT superfamily)
LTALKRSRPNRRTRWRRWHKTFSSSASDHVYPTGIPVSLQKGTVSKGMVVNRN